MRSGLTRRGAGFAGVGLGATTGVDGRAASAVASAAERRLAFATRAATRADGDFLPAAAPLARPADGFLPVAAFASCFGFAVRVAVADAGRFFALATLAPATFDLATLAFATLPFADFAFVTLAFADFAFETLAFADFALAAALGFARRDADFLLAFGRTGRFAAFGLVARRAFVAAFGRFFAPPPDVRRALGFFAFLAGFCFDRLFFALFFATLTPPDSNRAAHHYEPRRSR
jgi:hypothetical protein